MHECSGPGQPTLIQERADLVQASVMRFAHLTDQPDQLRALWERVAKNLADDWTLAIARLIERIRLADRRMTAPS